MVALNERIDQLVPLNIKSGDLIIDLEFNFKLSQLTSQHSILYNNTKKKTNKI